MSFAVKKFSDIVSDMIAWLVAQQSKLTDFNEGSVIRSLLESIALEVEQLYLRARVGYEEELSLVPSNVFAMEKQTGEKAAGSVVFSRPGTSGEITIPIGTLISTTDGTQFETTAVGTISNGNTDSGAVSIQATKEGLEGNVPANTITVIVTPIVGVESVDNSAATTGGLDEETTEQLLQRFREFIEGLGKSNVAGLIAGAKSVQGVRSASVAEHFPPVSDYNATVYIDDGAGNASQALIDAVELVLIGDGTDTSPGYKAAGVNLRVLAPTKVVITVAVEVTDDGTIEHSAIEYLIKQGLQDYINNLWIGQDVIRNRLIDVIMGVAGIEDISLTTPSGNTSIGSNQIARIASTDITVTWSS